MSLDFTAIDFETANSYRGSPCSVGLVKVRDGQIIDQSSTLIHPPTRFDHFDSFNTWLHGINAEMVARAPSWRQVIDWIIRYTAADTLVCHNAGFDIGVIRSACTADDLPWPSVDFLCTLVLARRSYRLPSYRLPFVAAQCDIDFDEHHQAGGDVRCAASIAVAMARKQGAQTLAGLAGSFGVSVGRLADDHYTPSMWRGPDGHGYKLIRPDVNPDADPGHPLYGRVIVFTGALMSRTRQEAWDDVVRAGGKPEAGVTKHTNILVIGDINPAVLAPGTVTTGKAAKAFALQDKGQDIEVMTEDDFIRSL